MVGFPRWLFSLAAAADDGDDDDADDVLLMMDLPSCVAIYQI